MRLQVNQPAHAAHKELVGALGWRQAGELFTCSDDGSICRWQSNGESLGQVCTLEAYFTDMAWCAPLARKAAAGANDVFAIACTDGSIRVLSSAGRLEKSIDAHRGAALVVRWTADGTAIISGGEDGQLKLWSRNGSLRSTVAQADSPIYAACLSPDSELVLFSNGQHLTTRSLANNSRQSSWKAHEGVVTAVDWSPVNGMIVSGAEDCRYKVWDSFGRCLYSSRALEQPVTSLAWAPGGGLFAVGSFSMLMLCDRMGWSHSKARTQAGSLVSLAWSPDGTQLAAGSSAGRVCFAQLLDVYLEDGRVHATLDAPNRITVTDILSESQEQLDFREPVVQVSLGHGHLVAATNTQCHVFSTSNWATPHISDLREAPLLLLQCERSFVLLDMGSGLQVCTYEGRHVCNPKPPGLRPELLSAAQVSLSNDTLAVLEGAAATSVRFFETAQAKPVGEPYQHSCAVQQICLSQAGTAPERLLALVDGRKDLWLLSVSQRRRVKLGSSVDNCRWHDSLPLLAAMVDNVLTVWSWPGIVWVDEGLLGATCQSKQECSFGAGSQVTGFFSSKLLVRRSDGSQMAASIPPYPLLLHDLARRGQWDKATRLCRFTADQGSWALLAGLAVAAQQLSTAEAAYAALGAVDSLAFVLHCKQLLGEERAAELAVFRRQPDEGEALLLKAGLVYRAIKMRIKLHHWQRALELANKHQQHLDTVLMYRNRYLAAAGLPEVLPQFKALAGQVTINEDAIRDRIKADSSKRAAAAGAKR